MSSQYNLQLKATLDSSQVQQELQKLRTAQNAVEQTSTGRSGATAASNIARLDTQKLTNAITRLDQTIASLQKVLKNGIPTTPRSAPISPGRGWLPANLQPGQVDWKKWLQTPEYRQLNKTFLEALAKSGMSGVELNVMQSKYGSFRDPNFAHNMLSKNPTLLGNINYEEQVLKFQQSQQQLATEQLKQLRQQAKFARGFGTLFGGQVLADLGGMVGGKTGSLMQMAGVGLQAGGGAAMTATMMGLGRASLAVGIAVGVFSAISKAMADVEQFAESVRKATQALEDNYKAQHTKTLGISESIASASHQRNADKLLKNEDLQGARQMAEHWTKAFEQAQDQLINSGNPLEEERKIKETAEKRKNAVDHALDGSWMKIAESWLGENAFKMVGEAGASIKKQDVKNMIDADAQKQIAEMQARYADKEKNMQTAQAAMNLYSGVVSALESNDQKKLAESLAEVKARTSLTEANDINIAGYMAQSQANKTQAFANDVISSKSLGPLEKFNQIVQQLDQARAEKNNVLAEAFSISKYIKENEGSLDSTEMKAKQKQQANFERDAMYISQRIGILENALGSIQSTAVAPDLSHVTSLAQYGFNMGEKDDTIERMDKYYSRSINLQQQIKDKLQEGIKTEAVYN